MIGAHTYKTLLAVLFVVLNAGIKAQMPPADLYLCKINLGQKNIVSGNPVFLNEFNASGYNNQPFFWDYNKIFITSAKGDKQTDIFQLDLENKEFFRFTSTENISEFSPRTNPDGKTLNVVRIEEDGKTQTLWAYPLDRSGFGYNVLPSLNNVGYYTWITPQKVALFLVDSLPALAVADVKTGQVLTIQENIGRCLKEKNGSLYFTQKTAEGFHKVKRYDVTEQTIQHVFNLPPMVEDYELLGDGKFLFGKGSQLFLYNPEMPSEPHVVSDLSGFGIRNIKRIAAARDRLILVDQKL